MLAPLSKIIKKMIADPKMAKKFSTAVLLANKGNTVIIHFDQKKYKLVRVNSPSAE
jgi:hypothetical protein